MKSDNAFERMCETISSRSLLTSCEGALLMVSGGSDSTSLAYLMERYRSENPHRLKCMAMFHMNHKLRGEDAEADAEFVQRLASHLEIPLFICEMDIASEAARTGDNIEALARHERYKAADEALASMAFHEGIPLENACIITAHTADDRIENLYMRTIVGTGPGGFKGMSFNTGNVVRPLLDCTREELRDYIRSLGESAIRDLHGCDDSSEAENEGLWREDKTNSHTDRFRAYVRYEIIPKAKEWNPSLDKTLIRTMDLIADEDEMLQDMADLGLDENSEWLDTEAHSDGILLKPDFGLLPVPIQRRCIRSVLKEMLGAEERIDASSVEAVINSWDDDKPISGYVTNIQGDIAVSSNKHGVRIEPMAAFRSRRKRS